MKWDYMYNNVKQNKTTKRKGRNHRNIMQQPKQWEQQ